MGHLGDAIRAWMRDMDIPEMTKEEEAADLAKTLKEIEDLEHGIPAPKGSVCWLLGITPARVKRLRRAKSSKK